MSNIKIHGDLQVARQPGAKLTYRDDGTIDGTIEYRCDRSLQDYLPEIGDDHPEDPRCELYARDITYSATGLVVMNASYFGIEDKVTDPVLNLSTNANQNPIQIHPDFFDTLGGDSDLPLNGAKFDDETGEFLGFFDPNNENKLFGVEYYYTPGITVTTSYWTRDRPTLDALMSIVNAREIVSDFIAPPNVKNFLLIGQPYRQIGSHYQVTKQYLASGPDGWNTTIYAD